MTKRADKSGSPSAYVLARFKVLAAFATGPAPRCEKTGAVAHAGPTLLIVAILDGHADDAARHCDARCNHEVKTFVVLVRPYSADFDPLRLLGAALFNRGHDIGVIGWFACFVCHNDCLLCLSDPHRRGRDWQLDSCVEGVASQATVEYVRGSPK